MRLKDKIRIQGKLKVVTGLHIGGIKESFQIGGLDNPVIKIKKFKEKRKELYVPYIPGSSLKGKIRSLIERNKGDIKVIISYLDKNNRVKGKKEKKYKDLKEDDLKKIPEKYKEAEKIDVKAEPCSCGECAICILFGSGSSKTIKRPAVLIFRDAYLSNIENMNITEIKTENVINRVKGTAEHPRQIERVVPGTEFDVEIVFNVYDGDDVKKLLNTLKEGFELLQKDYLGGNGTRGYGKVDVSEIINDIDQKIQEIK